jgi:hypothetical protein
MASEGEDVGGAPRIPPRVKALCIALLVDLVCLPLALILWYVWPVVILAIVPYFGGVMGGRRVDRRSGLLAGSLAAALMMTIVTAVALYVFSWFPGESFDPFEPTGLGIVAACYLVAVPFGALGGRHGSIAAEKE